MRTIEEVFNYHYEIYKSSERQPPVTTYGKLIIHNAMKEYAIECIKVAYLHH